MLQEQAAVVSDQVFFSVWLHLHLDDGMFERPGMHLSELSWLPFEYLLIYYHFCGLYLEKRAWEILHGLFGQLSSALMS